jgi:hypothetical protein
MIHVVERSMILSRWPKLGAVPLLGLESVSFGVEGAVAEVDSAMPSKLSEHCIRIIP